MRYAFVALIVASISLAGVIRPDIGMLGYVWFSLMRPDIMAFSAVNNLSLVMAVCALLGSMRLAGNLPMLMKNRMCVAYLALQAPIAVSVFTSSYSAAVFPKYVSWLQMSVMVMALVLVIDNREKAKWLFLVLGVSLGLVGVKFGLYGVLHGGVRFDQGSGGFHSDNNTLALGLAMSLPLCWYGVDVVHRVWMKVGLYALCFFSVATILMTHSRGAVITLGVQGLMMWLKSRHKIGIAVGMLLLSAPSVLLVKDSLFSRVGTLSEGTEEGSIMMRMRAAQTATEVIAAHPLKGVGFGAEAFRLYVLDIKGDELGAGGLVAHNNWLQMWADSGFFAIAIFSAMLLGGIWSLGRAAKKASGKDPQGEAISRGLQLALIGFAVGSTFLSRTNYDYIYFLLICGGIWLSLKRAESTVSEEVQVIAAPAAPRVPVVAPPPAPTPTQARGLGRALRQAGKNLPRL